MAQDYINKKGFRVLKLNREETQHLGFGDEDGDCICMMCNELCGDDIYYVPVLSNETLCPQCLKNWLVNAIRFKEDIPIEEKRYNYVKEILGAFYIPPKHI